MNYIRAKSVNWLVICTLKQVVNFFITYWIYKSFRNEIIHVQCINHHAAMPLYELTCLTPYCHQNDAQTVFGYLTFWSLSISRSRRWPQIISWILTKSHCHTHLYFRKQGPYLTTIYSADYDIVRVEKKWKVIVRLENSLQFDFLKSCQCIVSEGTFDWPFCFRDTALQNPQLHR
jgi:hypothetical protein